MLYMANYDAYTKIAETAGTIQNTDTLFGLELKVDLNNPSRHEVYTSTLHPRELQTFDLSPYPKAELSIRCLDEDGKIPVLVSGCKLSLAKAKSFLRIDTDCEDALILSLIDAAVAYIEGTTGMTAENQTSPLVETLQAFLVANWFENRDGCSSVTDNPTILSLLKTVKSMAAET